ncbi:hypothetical protein KVR01_006905 [Diaporthe batatas]|uniref:uncharacterized protein n=1 Tax=Diaporthe batatas TaxID=748121 RepID=UPI001D056C8A|nr:uncharacterized protein KVR01_006905 [Diaporthe batatas]KAG8163608.1 hypothetical protein KVR01_006905 [Diaporthe batatas]
MIATTAQRTIRIAISGGGLAGATLFHALLKHPHLDVQIFESAEAFKEAGAAVGIARNALAALDLIGPSATASLQRAGAVPQKGVRFMLAQGPDAGDEGVMIDEIDAEIHQKQVVSIVHRAAFLRELLAEVPPSRMHASKKLTRVDRHDGAGPGAPMTLHFADGSTHECDVLIGADGIHSVVRGIVLGDGDPAASARNTGWWAIMALEPFAAAQACLGESLVNAEDPRQYGWTGDGAYLLHDVLSDGRLVQIIACGMDEDARGSDRWQTTLSADEIREHFRGWPAHLTNAVEKLLCDEPEQQARYLWEHPPASTYVSDCIAVMGDAAHATTPWQGSGAGMAIEDSLILSTLLGHAETVAQALLALRVYDQVRRPRTQQVVESSRGTGMMRTGLDNEVGLDVMKFRQRLLSRWDFIIDFDSKQHCTDALAIMNDLS